jgi:hypothetical protein
MPPSGKFTRKVQKDMVTPLKHIVWRLDKENVSDVGDIIGKIMEDVEDEHCLAREIMEMLLHLDCNEKSEICQIIFDGCKKRALRFIQGFGFDFLNKLKQLEHNIFWLDIRSLREILQDAIKNHEKGLIKLKPMAYDELCSTVFAQLHDPGHEGTVSARVFRRLIGKNGKVKIECTFPNRPTCTCDGESLSFRGVYSKKCSQKVGNKFKAKIIPIKEVGQPKPKHQFELTVSVSPLHPVEETKQVNGRGLFFEDADEGTVKSLYDYISRHPAQTTN